MKIHFGAQFKVTEAFIQKHGIEAAQEVRKLASKYENRIRALGKPEDMLIYHYDIDKAGKAKICVDSLKLKGAKDVATPGGNRAIILDQELAVTKRLTTSRQSKSLTRLCEFLKKNKSKAEEQPESRFAETREAFFERALADLEQQLKDSTTMRQLSQPMF